MVVIDFELRSVKDSPLVIGYVSGLAWAIVNKILFVAVGALDGFFKTSGQACTGTR
jgi:hypothetical protein